MAVTARDAATVILAREAGDGAYEVLLTRRPETMRFMGGMYVFPGGALDPQDSGQAIEALSALPADDARRRIGEDVAPGRALGLYCCAVRELFEEVGVLLARTSTGEPVDPRKVRDDYAPRRDAFAEDAEAFARFLRAEGLVLATDLLVWHGRLVTPELSPVRFDARFFVAPCPRGAELVLQPDEVPEALWISPTDALRASGEGRLSIPIPTMAVLQGLSEVPGYEQLMRGARPVREILTADLSPLVSQVLAPNPGLATGPGTNTYIAGRGVTAIIDPGVPDPIFIEKVVRKARDRGRPSMILLTHMHPDHTGGAGILAEQIGCPVAGWKGAAEGTVTKPLDDGDVIELGEATLRVLYAPGHASHHVCFVLEQEMSLFAGDVVAGLGTVVIAPPDGNMSHYLATLERLASSGIRRIYPGHGPVIDDGPAKIAEYIAHRRGREAQVVDALQAGLRDIPSMVKHIYTEVPEALHAMAEMSVLAHLEMLEDLGRARHVGAEWDLVG